MAVCLYCNREVKPDALNPRAVAWHYNLGGTDGCLGSYAQITAADEEDLPFEAEQAARYLGISDVTARRLRREIK